METSLIWIITAALIIAVFVPYYLKFRQRQKLDKERKKDAVALGVPMPRNQYPLIDASRCIGVGSCVDACPEGDVLGVVYGKATIINGNRCVGHGFCELVCPVGALKVGLGDIKTRDDIPILDENNQTNIKGLYIAGELAGYSLIRNAMVQGRKVIERIALDEYRSQDESIKDVIIVGCGPAGLSASLSAIRNRLSYLTIDQQDPGGTILQYPRRKLAMTQPVEIPLYGWLNEPEYSKEFLLEIWDEVIKTFDVKIITGQRVENAKKCDEIFEVVTQGNRYKARNVVLAMGRRGTPRKIGAPGEHLPKVMYQLIDAQSYNDVHILVVGGGDSAVEAAIGLAKQDGNVVTVSYRKNQFFRIKKKNDERVNEMISRKKIKTLFNSSVKEIKEKLVLLQTEEGIIEMPNDYVFVFIGGIPPFESLKEMGIAFGGEVREVVQGASS